MTTQVDLIALRDKVAVELGKIQAFMGSQAHIDLKLDELEQHELEMHVRHAENFIIILNRRIDGYLSQVFDLIP